MKFVFTGIVAAALGIGAWQGRTLRDLRERERMQPGETKREVSRTTPFSPSPTTRIEPAALLAEIQAFLDLPEHSSARFLAENAFARKLATTTGTEMRALIEETISLLQENPNRKEIEQRLGQLLEVFHPATVLEDSAKKSTDLQRFRLTAWAWARRNPGAYLAWHESWKKEPEPEVPGYRLTALAPALLARSLGDPQSLSPSAFAGLDEIEDIPEMLGELAFSLPDQAGRLATLRAAASHPDAGRRSQWVRTFAENLVWNASFTAARKLADEAALPPNDAWTLCRTIAAQASDVPVAERYDWLARTSPAASEEDWRNLAHDWAADRHLETSRLLLSLPPSPRRDSLSRGYLDQFPKAETAWREALAHADATRKTPNAHP